MQISTRLILGGSQEHVLLTCEGLLNAGHEVCLVYGPIYGPEGSLFNQAVSGGYSLHEIKGKKVMEGKIAKFSMDDNLKIWVSDKIKRTKITTFKINRKNPLIKKIINNIENGLEIIKEIEECVPYDLINLHINDTKQKFQSTQVPEKIEFIDR